MAKKFKSISIDGRVYQFDSEIFRRLFDEFKGKRKTLDYEIELGDMFSVSGDAIHNWRFGANGPSDLDAIKEIAEYFGLSDYKKLLKKEDGTVMQISERQKDSLKRIYDAIIDFLDVFDRTDGFNDYWHELCEQGIRPDHVEEKLYCIAEEYQHKVELVLQKESIIIGKLDVFEELKEFVYDGLSDTYNDKLSYAYRFEAPVENIDGTQSGVTTIEDYTKALNRANGIIAPYMQ